MNAAAQDEPDKKMTTFRRAAARKGATPGRAAPTSIAASRLPPRYPVDPKATSKCGAAEGRAACATGARVVPTSCVAASGRPASDPPKASGPARGARAARLVPGFAATRKFAATVSGVVAEAEARALVDATAGSYVAAADGASCTAAIATVDDAALAAALFERLAPFLPRTSGGLELAGLAPRVRFLRYDEGAYFKPHLAPRPHARARFAATISLGAAAAGGQTVVYTSTSLRTLALSRGTALVHSYDVVVEETAVRAGARYAVCADVVYDGGGA